MLFYKFLEYEGGAKDGKEKSDEGVESGMMEWISSVIIWLRDFLKNNKGFDEGLKRK